MKWAIAPLLPLCLLIACRTPSPGIPLAADDPRPAHLQASLHRSAAGRLAMRASARLTLDAPDVSLNRPQRLAVERPARLRVEVLGLFDQIAGVMVTDGESYQFYDARSSRLEEGVVTSDLLWRLARIDLDPIEAVSLLLGAPRPYDGLSLGQAWLAEDGGIGFDSLDARGVRRQRFRFDPQERLRQMQSFDAGGELVFEGTFDDYRMLPAAPATAIAGAVEGQGQASTYFAYDLKLRFPRVDAKVRVRFKIVRLVESLPDPLFVLKLPDRISTAPGSAVRQAERRGGAL